MIFISHRSRRFSQLSAHLHSENGQQHTNRLASQCQIALSYVALYTTEFTHMIVCCRLDRSVTLDFLKLLSVGQYIDILLYIMIFIDLDTDTVLLFCYRYIEQSIYRDIGLRFHVQVSSA